jgi:hypothetical protein
MYYKYTLTYQKYKKNSYLRDKSGKLDFTGWASKHQDES